MTEISNFWLERERWYANRQNIYDWFKQNYPELDVYWGRNFSKDTPDFVCIWISRAELATMFALRWS